VIFINQLRQKNRGFLRQSGNDDRRQCPEILRLGASRHPPYRSA
jgi:hypothetical protein